MRNPSIAYKLLHREEELYLVEKSKFRFNQNSYRWEKSLEDKLVLHSNQKSFKIVKKWVGTQGLSLSQRLF